MPDVDIKRLRILRRRAEKLLIHVFEDLRPFRQPNGLTFRRKPDSRLDDSDINVTTSCSCLMVLALTDHLEDFYAPDEKAENRAQVTSDKVTKAFSKLVEAPWMSSGLTENNAFTTTLVLRLLGFLRESRVLEHSNAGKDETKAWALNVGIKDPTGLAEILLSDQRPVTNFLRQSLTDSGRTAIERWVTAKASGNTTDLLRKETTDAITVEINRIIYGPLIYESLRFPDQGLTAPTRKLLLAEPFGYGVNELNRLLLADAYPEQMGRLVQRSLPQIALEMGKDPKNFSINQYPPAVAVVYWYVDGLDRAEIPWDKERLTNLCKWASEQFNHQRSLVTAEHEAVMDPIAMAMAACLCHRLSVIAHSPLLASENRPDVAVPSNVELENSILQLFQKQTKTGIWPKYFPMFHYQEAGSNFCFTFEMLEAILVEFGEPKCSLLQNATFIKGLEKAVTWCEKNSLTYSDGEQEYHGWNSGGDIKTLKKDQPESWATAVVHMFLWEVQQVLSQRIQREILDSYEDNAKRPSAYSGDWAKLLNVDVEIQVAGRFTIKQVLEREIMGSSTILLQDIIDLEALATKLRAPSDRDKASSYIRDRLSRPTLERLEKYNGGNDSELQGELVTDLNRLLEGESIYHPERFPQAVLSSETNELLRQRPKGPKLAYLNRLLLAAVYQAEFSREQLSNHARQYRPFGTTKMSGRRSVLLFGPPGTSKTSLVRAFAGQLGWPILEIEPSHFLTKGMDGIYARANEIFLDLADLSGVVVFFDEMDALVRTRAGQQQDTMGRFLTTSMLPKLAKLHDDSHIVFFFATNYQDEFDAAIKRPGRFDILLCVWPPTWERKLQALGSILRGKIKAEDEEVVKQRLSELLPKPDDAQKMALDHMTFSEAATFFETLSRHDKDLKTALAKYDSEKFITTLKEFSQTITLREDGEHYKEYLKEKNSSRFQ